MEFEKLAMSTTAKEGVKLYAAAFALMTLVSLRFSDTQQVRD